VSWLFPCPGLVRVYHATSRGASLSVIFLKLRNFRLFEKPAVFEKF